MRNLLDGNSIANNILMNRTVHKGSFLLLEGDSDSKIYSSFIDDNKCKIIIANNKDNVISAINILQRWNFAGVLAVIDSDFWNINSGHIVNSNIIYTDSHDLETMILKTHALDKVLNELADKSKIDIFTKRYNIGIREKIIQSGSKIGYFRWLSIKNNMYLKFNGIVFSDFVDVNSLEIDINVMIEKVKINSKRYQLNDGRIRKQIESLYDPLHNLWDICNGHDLVEILVIGLQNAIGSKRQSSVSKPIIERHLRLAYDRSFFRKTNIYKSIRKWEKLNKPYRILLIGW